MMKKTIAMLAALMIAVVAIAATNVVSVNAVGYIKVDMHPSGQFTMVGLNFLDTSASTNLTMLEVFGTNQLAQSFLAGQCDVVYLWDRTQQQYVQYVQKSTDNQFYYFTNFTGSPVNPEVPLGSGLWVQSKPSATDGKQITLLGGVPMAPSYSDNITGNPGKPFFFIANPYPVPQDVNDLINTNDGAKGHFLAGQADQLYLWDTNNQEYITLALKSTDNKWYYFTNFTGSAPAFTLQPGEGAWLQSSSNFVWTENIPYSL